MSAPDRVIAASTVPANTNPNRCARPMTASLSNVVPPNVDDKVLRASGSDILRVVNFVGTDDTHVPGTQPVWLPGNGQLHGALADQHHFFPKVLMGRMIHFTGRDVAGVRLDLEAGMRFCGEHHARTVRPVGGH